MTDDGPYVVWSKVEKCYLCLKYAETSLAWPWRPNLIHAYTFKTKEKAYVSAGGYDTHVMSISEAQIFEIMRS